MRTVDRNAQPRSGRPTWSLRATLLAGATATAFAAPAFGQNDATEQPLQVERTPMIVQQWTIEGLATYSDNYRRLPDELERIDTYFFGRPDGRVEVPVSIDTPDNTILSIGLRGGAYIDRPSISGFISGSMRIGTYTNTDEIAERLAASADPQPLMTRQFDLDNDGTFEDVPLAGSTFGIRTPEETFIDPNMLATATLRVADNLFYVDGSLIAQEQTLGRSNFLVQEGIGQTNEEIILGGGSLSPYFYREFAYGGVMELRYRTTGVVVLDERLDGRGAAFFENVTGNDDPQYTNDSYSNEVIAEFSSGALLDRLSFNVGAFGRTITEKGSDVLDEVDFEQASTSFDVEYGLNRSLSVTAGVGYDEVELNEEAAGANSGLEEEELGGVFWRAGFRYAPSRRTRLSLSVGERYNGTLVEGNLSHRPTERLTIDMSASRTLSSGTQDFAATVIGSQSQAFSTLNQLAESQRSSSRRFLERAVDFEAQGYRTAASGQFGINARDRYTAGLRGNFDRTNLSVEYAFSEADFGDFENRDHALDLRARRLLSRRATLDARARFRRDEGLNVFLLPDEVGQDERKANSQVYSLGLDYAVGRQLSAYGELRHVTSERENDEFGEDGTQFDFEENAVTLGVRWSF
jgi:uncharacterized protein (PEP-CTERM system associated)